MDISAIEITAETAIEEVIPWPIKIKANLLGFPVYVTITKKDFQDAVPAITNVVQCIAEAVAKKSSSTTQTA